MADLIIKNMKMPKYTTKAEFGIDADGNPLCMVYHEDGTEPDIYDVIPLPEGHGNMIDVDALEDIDFESCDTDDYYEIKWRVRGENHIRKIIKDAPIIIPTEGSADNG